jgi:predicted ABC-class ATPase
MNQRVKLVVPEAPTPSSGALAVQRKIEKRGVRLGVLDNSKGNADHLLAMVVEGVRAALPIASVVSLRKAVVSLPAPKSILDQLTAEADFVVSAMAD